jgi:hypothetical protein
MNQCSWTVFLSVMLGVGPWVPQPVVTVQSATDSTRGGARRTIAQASQVPVTPPPSEPARVTVHPWTLGLAIDEFAGHRVRILNARVVTMFDPRAFLIESDRRYDMGDGYRDRTLVLVDGAGLRVTQEQLAGSTVIVLGLAKTIVGSRVLTRPVWPAWLDRERLEDLEVRAVVIATSVQTADGTELTH